MITLDRNPDGSRTTITCFHYNSDEENAQLMAWHEDQTGHPGHGVRFDYRATPEIADRVKELLRRHYGWALELDRGHLFFMRKPEEK